MTPTAPTIDRAKAEAAGWIYEHSAALGMDYAIRQTAKGTELITADRTRYTAEEAAILDRVGGITPGIHAIKRVFEGRIVSAIPPSTPERIVPSSSFG